MDPTTDEADEKQLSLAQNQGDAYGKALEHMVTEVADDGGQKEAGNYKIGYAIEQAEGMYKWDDGELRWQEPEEENLHIEVAVQDAGDGRFIPGVRVEATLIDSDGNEIGTHEQPLIWHPMIYHYGRNWKVPADGTYKLKVRVEPPQFLRHDKMNGQRFTEPVEVEFAEVKVKTGQG